MSKTDLPSLPETPAGASDVRAPAFPLATGSQPVLAGGIWASCGHKLADDDGPDGMGFCTITLGDDCDFDGVHRCAFYGCACRKCRDEMEARNMLATREEADAWIRDGILPERMKCEKPRNRVGRSFLSEWERVAFDREPGFLGRFCHDAWQLAKVSWSSETMHVVYIAECGQHITDSFPLRDWLEFYQANNEVSNSDPQKP